MVISKEKIHITLIYFDTLKCLGRRYHPQWIVEGKEKKISSGQIVMISNRMMQKIKNHHQAGNNHPFDKSVLQLRYHKKFSSNEFSHYILVVQHHLFPSVKSFESHSLIPPSPYSICLCKGVQKCLTLDFLFIGFLINFFTFDLIFCTFEL